MSYSASCGLAGLLNVVGQWCLYSWLGVVRTDCWNVRCEVPPRAPN